MMGGHHAATGAAAWVAVTSTSTYALGWHPLSASGVFLGAVVCAGAALLPDADHHNATIAHSLPPVSRVVCAGVGRISGGHRHGTHSILAVAVFTALAWVSAQVVVGVFGLDGLSVGAGLVSMMLVAFAAKALKLVRGRLAPWLVAVAAGVLVALSAPSHWSWLPLAVGVGVIIHIVGDMLTTGGVPLLWPWVPKPPEVWAKAPVLGRIWQSNGYMGVPVLGNAGSTREWALLGPVGLYAIVGVVEAGAGWVTGSTPGWFMDWFIDVSMRIIQGA